jgi:hypothetical protein
VSMAKPPSSPGERRRRGRKKLGILRVPTRHYTTNYV